MPGLPARSTNIPPLGSFCPFRGTRWRGPQHLSADKQQVLLTGTADGASLTLFYFLCCLQASPLDRSLSCSLSDSSRHQMPAAYFLPHLEAFLQLLLQTLGVSHQVRHIRFGICVSFHHSHAGQHSSRTLMLAPSLIGFYYLFWDALV